MSALVKSRHVHCKKACLLYPRKRTSDDVASSPLCPISLAVPTLRLTLPSQLLERSGDAALIGGTNFGRFDMQSLMCNLADGDALLIMRREKFSYVVLPGIRFISRCLFCNDVIALEIFIRPPCRATAKEMHGLGK